MPSEVQKSAKYPCPIFEYETGRKPHSCAGFIGDIPSKLREHLSAGKEPHVPFLQRCTICKHEFIDKRVFEQDGHKGKTCSNYRTAPKPVPGDEAHVLLIDMVLLYVNEGKMKSTGKYLYVRHDGANTTCRRFVDRTYPHCTSFVH
jgi:hypothetical protein